MNWNMIGALAELAGALAVVVSLVYLARQIRMANRLARAEAYRSPNSDLNALNAAFGTDEKCRAAFRRMLMGSPRGELTPDERQAMDFYVISCTNVFEQLAREVREDVLDDSALDNFGARGLFKLPYYRTSWPLYRDFLSSQFVNEMEARWDLDPSIEAVP